MKGITNMNKAGIVRKFDDFGRIAIPIEIRLKLFKKENVEGQPMEIFLDKNGTICLKPYEENEQPDMREKVQEYIDELQTEIRRLGEELEENMNGEACMVTEIESKINTLQEVVNDLKGRLNERI
jgi:bifunctional DNA-binding transcriptional regulator/antitoxin component of YhaV-PrlF toxin-antitoxin module